MIKHWNNFWAIAYTEFWDRINYYGLQSLLVLYLTQKLGFSENESLNLFGTYVALAFGFTIIGGFLSDKILGFYNSAILGALLVFLGNILLIHSQMIFFYLGLAFVIVGIGFIKPSNTNLIGLLYKEDSYFRVKLFSIFYFCLNMGCILGPIFYGLAIQLNKFTWCYAFTATGILSGLIILIALKTSFRSLEETRKVSPKQLLLISLALFLSITSCTYLLIQHNSFFWFLLFLVFIIFLYSLQIFKNLNNHERKSTTALLIPFLASIIFFTMLLQVYSSITLYIHKSFQAVVFGWAIPTSWFSSIEPIFVSLLLPFLTYFWKAFEKRKKLIHSQEKIVFGLFVSSLAFLLFMISTYITGHPFLMFISIVLANALLAIGELSIITISMSLTNILAPEKLKGTAMGLYFFSLMSSGFLAGQIAKLAPPSNFKGLDYSNFFLLNMTILLITALVLQSLNKYKSKNK